MIRNAVMFVALGLVFPVVAQGQDKYTIDPGHSSVVFRVKHMNVGAFYGRFNEVKGSITADSSDPAKLTFDVTIRTASIDTNENKRDQHLKGPDFFDAKKHATIRFKSKSVKPIEGDRFKVTGDMTLHGVTKSMSVEMVRTGEGKSRFGYMVGYETTFEIKRSDFGMNKMLDTLGDEVRVYVGLEAGKK